MHWFLNVKLTYPYNGWFYIACEPKEFGFSFHRTYNWHFPHYCLHVLWFKFGISKPRLDFLLDSLIDTYSIHPFLLLKIL